MYCGATLATLHLQKVFLQITHFLPHLRHNSISLSGPGIISDETINMSKIIADTVEMGDVLRHANHIDQSIIPCLFCTTVKLVFRVFFADVVYAMDRFWCFYCCLDVLDFLVNSL